MKLSNENFASVGLQIGYPLKFYSNKKQYRKVPCNL